MKTLILIIIAGLIWNFGLAQGGMKGMDMKDSTQMKKKKTPIKKDTAHKTHTMNGMQMNDDDMDMVVMKMDNENMAEMPNSYSINLPMTRDGSGTSWMPDETPMYALMKQNGKTSYMFHGNIFARYNSQDIFKSGSKDASKYDAPNWLMAMVTHKLSNKDLLSFHLMMSLDPFLVGGNGYPLLFQSGESYKGQPLVNRQHPHDLFSELSLGYSHAFSKNVDAFIYVGYPGEPAIGPTAFMHRTSTMNNPDAPIGHHWQDATHITFGVATFGLRWKKWMGEFSKFTGAEPNEDRYNFDKATFNSYSYRLSFAPSKNWSLQASHAHIKSPEALEPGKDVDRTTASAIYAKQMPQSQGHFTATFVWGLNDYKSEPTQQAYLLEANWQQRKHAIYGRYEFVQKSNDELGIDSIGLVEVYNINAFTLGYNHVLASIGKFEMLLGAQATLNIAPTPLQNTYGKSPMAAEVYLQLHPKWMKM